MKALFFLSFIFIACCKEEKSYYKPYHKKGKEEKYIHLQKAALYIGSQSYLKAEKELKRAIEIDPKDYKLWFTLGNVYDKMDEDKKAIEAYIVGIRLKGRNKDEKSGTSSLRNPFLPMQKRDSPKP